MKIRSSSSYEVNDRLDCVGLHSAKPEIIALNDGIDCDNLEPENIIRDIAACNQQLIAAQQSPAKLSSKTS